MPKGIVLIAHGKTNKRKSIVGRCDGKISDRAIVLETAVDHFAASISSGIEWYLFASSIG